VSTLGFPNNFMVQKIKEKVSHFLLTKGGVA
jgi:hypothetical protein